ncbi:MAG: rod shape-determining protein MreC [Clostridia bacterium]|nr:rod shape-determining protein MreC [Clostridia bacterium]
MYKNKKNGIIGIVITVIILILIVIFSNGDKNSNFLQNAANNLVMPIQNGLTFLKNKLSGNSAFFSDLDYLKDENKKLKEKNNELEQSLRELENIKTENQTLKEYMNLAEKYKEYKTIPGYVINKDISNYSKTMVINLGKKDGVEVNMTVIGNEGLVGHVISVTDSTAKVQTIIDTASSVSCSMSTTKDSIVCKGTLDEKSALKAMYIPTDANIIQGDSIETSGIGGIYPKGIHIGTVKKVTNTQNMTDRYALIETAINFDKIDTVLVITNK